MYTCHLQRNPNGHVFLKQAFHVGLLPCLHYAGATLDGTTRRCPDCYIALCEDLFLS